MKNRELERLIAAAKQTPMSDSEMQSQRVSFAFGNAAIENPAITRQVVEHQAKLTPVRR